MKGQASIEMLTTVAIVLVFLVPMALLLLTMSSQNFEEVSKSQADVTVKKLAHTINTIYLGGNGSSATALINLPSNTKSLNISNGEVKVTLSISGGLSENSYPLIAELKEEYYTDKKGLFWLKITNVNHKVIISE